MHMADALLSPTVGGVMWAASATTIAACSAKLRRDFDDRKIPLMGVAGAFVFAAQMINFTIPATGSSGHLGGGLLLAVLLGPYAAFLAIASVLVVQALFFADGGLLALGCNMFNLGFFPAFIAFPLIYRPIAGNNMSRARIVVASILAGVAALQMGAFSVVVETVASGVSSLPFKTFVALMQPIHLAIGLVEGVVTAAVISFVHKARPEILQENAAGHFTTRKVVIAFLAAAVVLGGVVSWFASKNPDGLEWSIGRLTGKEELEAPQHGVHEKLAGLQKQTSIFPDYAFKKQEQDQKPTPPVEQKAESEKGKAALGTSVSGIVGGFVTLLIAFLVALLLRKRALPQRLQPLQNQPHDADQNDEYGQHHQHEHSHHHEHRHSHAGHHRHEHAHSHSHGHDHPHGHSHKDDHKTG